MSAAKDLHRLMRNIGDRTDGQASVDSVDWDDGLVNSFKVAIRPNSGYFKGGTFQFQILLGLNYPSMSPPTVRCLTDIVHPNIDTCDGGDTQCTPPSNICLNLLEQGTWDPRFGLESIVLGLIFLLSNPNFDNTLGENFQNYEDGAEGFAEMVYYYMRGVEVGENYYDAHFLSNVEENTDMSCSTSGLRYVPTTLDVIRINAMRSAADTSERFNSTKQHLTHDSLTSNEGLTSMTPHEYVTKQESMAAHGSLTTHEDLSTHECLTAHEDLSTHECLTAHERQAADDSLTTRACLTTPESLNKQHSNLSTCNYEGDFKEDKNVDRDGFNMQMISVEGDMVLVNTF